MAQSHSASISGRHLKRSVQPRWKRGGRGRRARSKSSSRSSSSGMCVVGIGAHVRRRLIHRRRTRSERRRHLAAHVTGCPAASRSRSRQAVQWCGGAPSCILSIRALTAPQPLCACSARLLCCPLACSCLCALLVPPPPAHTRLPRARHTPAVSHTASSAPSSVGLIHALS
jgi:hypothetical protein